MPSSIRAVLFDVDGTLFDRNAAQGMILRVIVADLADVFAGLDAERVARAFEESDRLTLVDYEAGVLNEDFRTRRSSLFLDLLGLDESHAGAITEMYRSRYPTMDAPVPGAASVVRRLAGAFPLGVVSNGFPDVQFTKLRTLGVDGMFGCVVLSEQLGAAKPDPAIFHHAAGLLGVAAEDCVHVGDSYKDDILGARAAGMRACWFNPDSLPAADAPPDFQVRSLDELPALLGPEGGSLRDT